MSETHSRSVSSLFTTPLILFFIGIILFAALLNSQHELAVLCLLIIGINLILRVWTRYSPHNIECKLSLNKNKVFAGDGISLQVHITNRKFLPVRLQISFSVGGLYSRFSNDEALGAGTILFWHQRAGFQWDLSAAKRGIYNIGPVKIFAGDIFGFFKNEFIIENGINVTVYPKLVPVKSVSVPKRDFFGVPGSKHFVNDPVYILGTTDYNYSRPSRYIHWKASARHLRLQEKLFESTQQEKILIIADTTQFSKAGADEAFERVLETAASLVLRLSGRNSVGFLTNGQIQDNSSSYIPVSGNHSGLTAIFEVMAKIKMDSSKPVVDILRGMAAKTHWGTSCIIFTFKKNHETAILKEYLSHRRIPAVTFEVDDILELRKDQPDHSFLSIGDEVSA